MTPFTNHSELVSFFRMLFNMLAFTSVLASVDYETDRKIQDTIAHEFEDRTILCIARKPNEPFFYNWPFF